MKIFLFLIVILSLNYTIQNINCPPTGDGHTPQMRRDDSLKNRIITTRNIDTTISLSDFFVVGDDTKRFNSSTYVSVVGYFVNVKYGNPETGETCNCHSTNKADLDLHIELSLDSGVTDNKKCLVCEITRYNKNPNLTYDNIKKLKGKKVRINGYLFFDAEHKQNAVNTNPNGTHIWRPSCWEIHPTDSLNVVN